jgi:hypothetical protein
LSGNEAETKLRGSYARNGKDDGGGDAGSEAEAREDPSKTEDPIESAEQMG